jgi:hypothetical protein
MGETTLEGVGDRRATAVSDPAIFGQAVPDVKRADPSPPDDPGEHDPRSTGTTVLGLTGS